MNPGASDVPNVQIQNVDKKGGQLAPFLIDLTSKS